jgi:hypothetical protein
MNDRQESLAWGLVIGGAILWWWCRRRGLTIGSSVASTSGASGDCGCNGSIASATSTDQARYCPPPNQQTSYLYSDGYSQQPAVSYVAAYYGTNIVNVAPIATAPTIRTGTNTGDRALRSGTYYGGGLKAFYGY